MLLAKTVIPNRYWILRDADRKVGNIEAGPDGFQVKINNEVQTFKSMHTIRKKVAIDFEVVENLHRPTIKNQVHGYPTKTQPYNAIYDIKHQVPLWTKELRSKSWYAAGWYRVKQGRSWVVVFCPKLIALERYPYQGPFHDQAQTEQAMS